MISRAIKMEHDESLYCEVCQNEVMGCDNCHHAFQIFEVIECNDQRHFHIDCFEQE